MLLHTTAALFLLLLCCRCELLLLLLMLLLTLLLLLLLTLLLQVLLLLHFVLLLGLCCSSLHALHLLAGSVVCNVALQRRSPKVTGSHVLETQKVGLLRGGDLQPERSAGLRYGIHVQDGGHDNDALGARILGLDTVPQHAVVEDKVPFPPNAQRASL